MKQILIIIVVILLFIISGLIFWAGLAPISFNDFFSAYPEITDTANQIGILKNKGVDSSDNTLSEPILGTTGEITIKGTTWSVEIANNDASRAQGLSNRKTLFNKKGMLFVFDKLAQQSFWMKDMLIPIDMIFFDDNWKIVLIESDLDSNSFPNTYGGAVKSQYVLETNANEANIYNLQVGDQAIFLNK